MESRPFLLLLASETTVVRRRRVLLDMGVIGGGDVLLAFYSTGTGC